MQHGTRATRQTHETWELSRYQSTDARTDERTVIELRAWADHPLIVLRQSPLKRHALGVRTIALLGLKAPREEEPRRHKL